MWVLVWIGCGSVMEVCDFSLGQRLKCGFWFGSVVGRRWWFVIMVWIGGGGLWILIWIGEVGLLWFE